MECSDIPSHASHAVPLREGWVFALEDQLQRKFTKFYNCNVTGRSITSENIPSDGHFSIAPDEHALYFLPVMTAREILRVMSNHNQAVLKHGKSSACFILPKHKAEWNSRVVHMQNLGNLIDTSKHSILDQDAIVKKTAIASSNQSFHNMIWMTELHNSRRAWEIQFDSVTNHGNLLTSLWNASVAGLPSQILLDTGAQQNFVDRKFLEDNFLQYTESSSQADSVKLGNGSVASIYGKVTIHLQIRNYHTNMTLFVTDLSEDINAVLGEPWLRQSSAHIEYGPSGMAALKLWKGVRRFTLTPNVVQDKSEDNAPVLSALQCKRAMKHAKGWFLVNVIHILDEKPQAQDPEPPATAAEAATQSVPPPCDKPGRQRLIKEAQLKHLLHKYRKVFQDLPDGLPPDRGVKHTINLTENRTPFKHSYRLSPAELEEAKRQVAELINKGFIQPSQSPFGAPILFVQKKDGSLRMCIDYRGLNAITERNRYPLPNIADLLDKFTGATVFSSLDLASGYHQIRISDEDVPKTAFTTPFGHYEFRMLSFGLTNAPSTFQAVMNEKFGHLHTFCVVYLDDILIFSKTPEEHLKHLDIVLQILEREGMFAKLKKCDFNKPELLYLRHIIGQSRVEGTWSWEHCPGTGLLL